MTQRVSPSPSAQVVDLAAISGPARRLIGLYDQQDDRRVDVDELRQVLGDLAGLPPVPGAVGRDTELLTNPPRGTARAEVEAAIDRLRRVSAVRPVPPPPTPRCRPRPRRPRPPRPLRSQPALPGLEPTPQEDTR